jgi:hypothetical protein
MNVSTIQIDRDPGGNLRAGPQATAIGRSLHTFGQCCQHARCEHAWSPAAMTAEIAVCLRTPTIVALQQLFHSARNETEH